MSRLRWPLCRHFILRDCYCPWCIAREYRKRHMTREEEVTDWREAQRRSFAFGNCNIENPKVTREIVQEEARKMDADLKQKIETWLTMKLTQAGIQIGDFQPVLTWQYRDTDIFQLQPKIGNHFVFSLSGIITEDAIIAAYQADQNK